LGRGQAISGITQAARKFHYAGIAYALSAAYTSCNFKSVKTF
jgi:hypothetical protein